jgi:hypothetical protein
MLNRRLIFSGFFLSFILLSFCFQPLALSCINPWYCAFEDTANISKCQYIRPSIDTIHTLAIYCAGRCDTGKVDLPSYWATVWADTGKTIPQYFRDNSNGKYLLTCDPKIDTVNGIQVPFFHPSLHPDTLRCSGGGAAFADSIFIMVDSVINFSNYDQDQDGIVDGFFFIIVNATTISDWVYPCLGDFSSKTQYSSSPVW